MARRQDGKRAIGLLIVDCRLRNIFSIINHQSTIINLPCCLAVLPSGLITIRPVCLRYRPANCKLFSETCFILP
ncbi:hypothetical protein FJZ31_23255 [Candidatus Poribacteria bacterium]|nr:hypothetical protein [Candidatus Poribacteria bacterium]